VAVCALWHVIAIARPEKTKAPGRVVPATGNCEAIDTGILPTPIAGANMVRVFRLVIVASLACLVVKNQYCGSAISYKFRLDWVSPPARITPEMTTECMRIVGRGPCGALHPVSRASALLPLAYPDRPVAKS
jgi:hypothetical protein